MTSDWQKGQQLTESYQPSQTAFGLLRLTQFYSCLNEVLAGGAPEIMIDDFFTETAVVKHVFIDKTTSLPSTFETPIALMHRFVKATRAAGLEESLTTFAKCSEHAIIHSFPGGSSVVGYIFTAGHVIWTCCYSNGTNTVCHGNIQARFTIPQYTGEESRAPVGLKMSELQYTKKLLTHTVSRSILRVPSSTTTSNEEAPVKGIPPIVGSSLGGQPAEVLDWLMMANTISRMSEVYTMTANGSDPRAYVKQYDPTAPVPGQRVHLSVQTNGLFGITGPRSAPLAQR